MIIGGGYAGQAAASRLAAAGLGGSVLLVDRRGRAGWPPSSTSGIASYWLDRLGFPPSSDAVASPIHSFRLVVSGDPPDTERVLAPNSPLSPNMGVVLQEHNFLGAIEAESVKGGVTVWRSAHAENARRIGDVYEVDVREGAARRTVTCRWLLDAGGYDSRISRRFGLTTPLQPEDRHNGIEITIPNTGQHLPDRVTLYLGNYAPSGYAWVFPSREGGTPHLRVGIGTPLSVTDARGVPIPVSKYFRTFLDAHPELDLTPHHRCGGVIPTYRPNRTLHRRRLLSLGDAARLCDPLTGGGIHQGLASGVHAADAVARSDPNVYEYGMVEFIREMRTRYRLKQVLLGMNEDELRRTMDAVAAMPIPDGSFSPYAMRREAIGQLRRAGIRPLRVLTRSHRLWRAVVG